MARSLGKKDKGGNQAGTRPVPTIEGTATEVTAEPEVKAESNVTAEDEGAADHDVTGSTPEDHESGDVKAEAAETEAPALPEDETEAKEGDGDDDTRTPEPPETHEAPEPALAAEAPGRGSGGRGILGSLAAGLLGGLIGAGALAFAWAYLPMNAKVEAPDLAPLEGRIAKLESAPKPDSGEALASRVAGLETSLKAMANAAKEGGSVGDAAAISEQIGAAEQRLDGKLDTALADAKAANAEALDALKKEVAGVEAKLRALANAELSSGEAARLVPEIAVIDERLSKIESTLPALLDAVDEDQEDTKAATQAIAFANLRAAVTEGRPYASELATLASLSPGAGDLGRLLDYEDKGIPTLPELTQSFKEARAAALSSQAPASDGSILDRFVASAESLVKVRRVDADAKGDGPGAVLARAEAQLEQGNLAASVAEVEKLQGDQSAAFAAWLDQAHARLDAEETLKRLQNILLVSLGSGARGSDQTNEQ